MRSKFRSAVTCLRLSSDPLYLMVGVSTQLNEYTASATGCPCLYDADVTDCACCVNDDACQCPLLSATSSQQCVMCGDQASCPSGAYQHKYTNACRTEKFVRFDLLSNSDAKQCNSKRLHINYISYEIYMYMYM